MLLLKLGGVDNSADRLCTLFQIAGENGNHLALADASDHPLGIGVFTRTINQGPYGELRQVRRAVLNYGDDGIR